MDSTELVPPKTWLMRVLLPLAALAAFGLCGCIWAICIVRGPDFLSTIADPFVETEDYVFSLNQANCDIVVYGDSDAKTSINPIIVEKETGLKTCNIAQTMSMVALAGTDPLDEYLRHNRRPSFLVLQIAPETLYRDTDWSRQDPQPYMVWRLRHRIDPKTIALLLLHTENSVPLLRSALLKHTRFSHGALREFHQQYDPTLESFEHTGVLTLPKPPLTHCVLANPEITWPLDVAWMRWVRSTYSVGGTKVLIDLSPIPECDPHIAEWHTVFAPLVDHNSDIYPIALFNDDDRHMNIQGNERASLALATQIRQLRAVETHAADTKSVSQR